jgi:hypothetical protein
VSFVALQAEQSERFGKTLGFPFEEPRFYLAANRARLDVDASLKRLQLVPKRVGRERLCAGSIGERAAQGGPAKSRATEELRRIEAT